MKNEDELKKLKEWTPGPSDPIEDVGVPLMDLGCFALELLTCAPVLAVLALVGVAAWLYFR